MKRMLFAACLAFLALSPALAQITVSISEYEEPTPPNPMVGNYGNIRSVAVLSLLGDQLLIGRRHYIASLQMGDKDISAWKLDEENLAALTYYLGRRFAVKQIVPDAGFDAAAFHKDLDVGIFRRAPAYRKHLARFSDMQVDAFVIVRRAPRGLYYAAPQDKLYANFIIEIVDAHGFYLIGSSFSRIQEPGWKVQRIAIAELSPSVDFDSNFQTTARQWDQLHREMVALLRRARVETLRSLRLPIDLPRSDDPAILEPPPADGH